MSKLRINGVPHISTANLNDMIKLGSNIYTDKGFNNSIINTSDMRAIYTEISTLIDNKETFIEEHKNPSRFGGGIREKIIIEQFVNIITAIDDIILDGSQGHRLEYYIHKNMEHNVSRLRDLRINLMDKFMYSEYEDKDKAMDDIILYKAYNSLIQMKGVMDDDGLF